MMATARGLAAMVIERPLGWAAASAMTLAVALVPLQAHAEPVAASLVSATLRDATPGGETLEPGLAAMLDDVRAEARAAGVTSATLERAFAGLSPDPSLHVLLERQPEHVMAPWDYMGRLVSETRIAEGRRMLAVHAATLGAIERRYGVDRHIVVAIWGVESSYGTISGTRPVVRSLATLAMADNRRPGFWRKELVAALRILDETGVPRDELTGSWAGAMGHTQFMPTTFLAHAVDFDGDGRRELWRSIPDALASTAAYLASSGWRSGEPWGAEAVLPAGFDYRMAVARVVHPVAGWEALGVVPAAGTQWPPGLAAASILLPAGMHGPAFLAAPNFQAILRYNNASLYALAVGHLADRLAGRPGLAALWPTHDPPLDLAGRREVQERLLAAGHDVGKVDGILGDASRSALGLWQARQGSAADGWAGTRLLERMRAAAAQ
ncbi:MAG: lytic murein transglycosylase [Hyphomicrobiaceae bacterium]